MFSCTCVACDFPVTVVYMPLGNKTIYNQLNSLVVKMIIIVFYDKVYALFISYTHQPGM